MKVAAWIAAGALTVAGAETASAGEEPLYRQAPAWVVAAPAINQAHASVGAPIVLFDMQQRLEKGQVWSFVDMAVRADTPEAVAQLGTITFDWTPNQGDLIVHRVSILRSAETIDVLAGSKFTVLRREQQLERRVMLGTLTGTLTVPGLRAGDILRYAASITQADAALGGKAQVLRGLPAEPFAAQYGRVRASWPADSEVRVRLAGSPQTPTVAPRTEGGYKVWEATVPFAKQADVPEDAPPRFRLPPLMQMTDFASWQDLSRTFAPLFATGGLIKPGGSLAAEVEAIRKATTDPRDRAARALELVQSRISYMLFGMNGGNYVPQPPEKTWETRLGDCKAKTLLLLAILHALEIEAQPILARSTTGDFLPAALPMAADFDHVLVHARIGGEDLWLDGTNAGSRAPDLGDVPSFRFVLPVRAEGADLMKLPDRFNARPNITVKLELDQSAGVTFPNIFDLAVSFRGAEAAQMQTGWVQATPQQRRDAANQLTARYVGEALTASSDFTYDQATGVGMLKARGVTTTSWKTERGRRRQTLDLAKIEFAPDRARAAWRAIPAATGGPITYSYDTTILLPERGRGITLDGSPDVDETIAGAHLRRQGTLENGTYRLVETSRWSGAEISPEQIAAERAKAAGIGARTATLVAPEDAPRAADFAEGPLRAKLAPYDAIYAAIIARQPGEAEPYASRASFRAGILDWKGAAADIDKALSIAPSAALHLQRAALLHTTGDKAGAVRSAREATALDPANAGAVIALAALLGATGAEQEAMDLLQQRIDNGGTDRSQLIMAKADLLVEGGKAPAAVELLDSAIAGRPGDPVLLNARCWIKGTGNVALQTALTDCTKALQLTDDPAPILDSRAMVFYRLAQYQEALDDIDAALQSAPDLLPTRFMRGIVLKRLGRKDDGQAEIDLAKRNDPTILARYAKYGIHP